MTKTSAFQSTTYSHNRASAIAWLLTIGACVLFTTAITHGQDLVRAEIGSEFIRLSTSDEGEPVSLDVALVRFEPRNPSDGVSVDLVSAIHIAEADYYAELNRLFRGYDAVLYELVAPEGARIEPGNDERRNPVSVLQGGMTSLLNLEFQLDAIDYNKPNMIHADMTPREFQKSMQDRGESMFQILMRIWAKAVTEQSAGGGSQMQEVELLAAFFSKDRAGRLKKVLAEQFVNMEEMMDVFGGEQGSTLVTERNKKALRVLRREMRKGRKRIAIFYGAAHMSDLAERLESDFKLYPVKTNWIAAWNLEPSIRSSSGTAR